MLEVDAMGQPVVVEDLDPDRVLALLEEKKYASRADERDKLRLAAQWCVLHPATTESGVATWSGDALPGVLNVDESLGGEGTPAVSAFTPEPVAAALGVSTLAGMKLIADALDLQHRLPRIWRLVEQLDVEPWKARQVAQATHPLSKTAAGYVDAQLAPRLASCGFAAIQTAVAHAIAKYHPELLDQREKHGKHSWHVTLQHPRPGDFDGTSLPGHRRRHPRPDRLPRPRPRPGRHVEGTRRHRRPRDPQGQGPRRDRRPPSPARPHRIGQRHDRRPPAPPPGHGAPRGSRDQPLPAPALTTCSTSTPVRPRRSGPVERLGPATLAKIRDWVGGSQVTIRPVLDPDHCAPIDGHDPTEAMREIVILRDRHCVFPWCTRDARACDQDHIAPYVPLDEGGHPARPTPTSSPRSADATTAAKPVAAGATDDDPTTPTNGTAPTAGPTSSPPRHRRDEHQLSHQTPAGSTTRTHRALEPAGTPRASTTCSAPATSRALVVGCACTNAGQFASTPPDPRLAPGRSGPTACVPAPVS